MHEVYRLKAKQVRALPPGQYPDGRGLWLKKSGPLTGSWVVRVSIAGVRREMGLGPISHVSLAEARQLAKDAQNEARSGADPIRERTRRRRQATRQPPTFAEMAERALEARRADLTGLRAAENWMSALRVHVLPKLGRLEVTDVDQVDVRDALLPIWHAKASTARTALVRIGLVIEHAAAEGYQVDLQITRKARALLGKQRHKAEPRASMDWRNLPEFYRTISSSNQIELRSLALRLIILCASRPGEVCGMRIDEISEDGLIWEIPAERMKMKVGHRIPLGTEARSVIAAARPFADGGFLFPGSRQGSHMQTGRISGWVRELANVETHGFRSSFRTWVADQDAARWEVAETSLAHRIGGEVERSYSRSDYLEERVRLLQRWGDYVTGRELAA